MMTGCKTELYSNLSEKEANEMLTTLLRNGIASDKVSDRKATFTVRVAETQMADAVEILNEYGFPRESFESMGNLFKKEGLISSPLEERIRFIYALSQSVSETLSQIDGVITARVNVVLPENDPFAERIKPASASVFIKYRPDTNLQDIKSEIKMIVEKSIEGLDYEKISVVMLPARGSSSQTQRVPWTQIGALKLAPQSLGTFWAILGSLGIVLTAAIAGNGLLVWQIKKGATSNKTVNLKTPSHPEIKKP
jgi:type III secretion protein J